MFLTKKRPAIRYNYVTGKYNSRNVIFSANQLFVYVFILVYGYKRVTIWLPFRQSRS